MSGLASRTLLLLAAFAACLVLAACGDDEQAESTPTRDAPSPAEAAGCEQVEAPAPKDDAELPKPKERLDRRKTYVATVATSCGDFEITLDSKRAPRTGGSFKYLADKGFYDGLTFHRIVGGFVIQGGDPAGNGQGGPGYSVVEAPPRGLTYTKGVVAMAKTAQDPPGTAGSQFFIVTGADAGLPPEYAIVGRVTEGLDVVERIGRLGDRATEKPTQPVVISKVRVG
jgi:peptidyl-prolyl cis-trans isomerase B (cyclophilin B)